MTGHHLCRRSTLERVTYIICTVFIVFYIIFDILDVDGSDFPTTRAPVQRTVVMIEVPKFTANVHPADMNDVWVNVIALLLAEPEKTVRREALEVPRPVALNTARVRGYRVALPRSSISDTLRPL
jgi:hypothetical protein